MNNVSASKYKYLKTESFNNKKRFIKADENSSKKLNLKNLDLMNFNSNDNENIKKKNKIDKIEKIGVNENIVEYGTKRINNNLTNIKLPEYSITNATNSSNRLLTDRNISDSKLQQTHSNNLKYLNYLHLDEIKAKNENKDLKLLYNPNFVEDKNYLKFKFKDDIELCLIEKKFESNIKSKNRLIKNHRKNTNFSNVSIDKANYKGVFDSKKNSELKIMNNLKSFENFNYKDFNLIRQDKYNKNSFLCTIKNQNNKLDEPDKFKVDGIKRTSTFDRFYRYTNLISTPFYESKYYNIPDEEISYNDIKGIIEDIDAKCSFFKFSNKNKHKNPIISEAYITNYIRTYRESLNK